MLMWIGREDAQKNAPTASNAAGANAAEAAFGGRTDYRPVAALGAPTFSDPPSPDAKAFTTLAAKFALIGCELHVVTKDARSYFEVHRWNERHTCSTLHDLRGLLAQTMGGAT